MRQFKQLHSLLTVTHSPAKMLANTLVRTALLALRMMSPRRGGFAMAAAEEEEEEAS